MASLLNACAGVVSASRGQSSIGWLCLCRGLGVMVPVVVRRYVLPPPLYAMIYFPANACAERNEESYSLQLSLGTIIRGIIVLIVGPCFSLSVLLPPPSPPQSTECLVNRSQTQTGVEQAASAFVNYPNILN